jgi:spore germination cell wall hydrolase CwlJ-like protein
VVREGPHRPSWKGTGEMIPVRHRCQFSWYCDGKSDRINDMTTFDDIFDFTMGLVDGTIRVMDVTQGATHYHADYVSPAWAKTKTKTIEIEDHIFYRWEIAE